MPLMFVFLSLISSVPHLAFAKPFVVIVDPGHGGRDRGTVKNGINEANITLTVSRKLVNLLKKDPSFQASLTRIDDSSVSLYTRALSAKAKNADVFLSVHVNSSPDPRAKGAEFYFQNQLPPDQESMYLAHKENVTEAEAEPESTPPLTYNFIDSHRHRYPSEVESILNDLLDSNRILRSSELTKALKVSWKGRRKGRTNSVRQAPFYVLHQLRTPSALVELGFLTDPEDYADLTNPTVQDRMASDLYRGLKVFKDSMDKAL
jgi:N-acetylmuramoyl-L-alanine amidase